MTCNTITCVNINDYLDLLRNHFQTRTIFKEKMHDEAQILYSSTNTEITYTYQDLIRHVKPCILLNVHGIVIFLQQRPSRSEDGTARQNFEKGTTKGLSQQSLEPSGPVVSEGKKLKIHPPFSILATVAMLVESLDCRTQF